MFIDKGERSKSKLLKSIKECFFLHYPIIVIAVQKKKDQCKYEKRTRTFDLYKYLKVLLRETWDELYSHFYSVKPAHPVFLLSPICRSVMNLPLSHDYYSYRITNLFYILRFIRSTSIHPKCKSCSCCIYKSLWTFSGF